ncbi:MAG: Hsp20/alpha crystallin family protein [Dehalococcoidia bacterium]|nr:Hsp20/alpha crystallin family protein [Dehalococcoidia bacterium]
MLKRRYEVMWDISGLQTQQTRRLLDRLAATGPAANRPCPGTWQPAADVYETEAAIVVVIELAGVKETDVQVLLSRNSLIIRGERTGSSKGRRSYHQMEICSGPFERALQLPANVNAETARASFGNGLLEIVLPKQQKVVTRQVAITVISHSE